MDRVTYPNEDVQEYLKEHFIGVKLEQHIDAKRVAQLLRPRKLTWSPLFLVLGPSGIEHRLILGYYPPRKFIAELDLGRGLASLTAGAADAAEEIFATLTMRFENTSVVPEALFWQGIACYRSTRQKKDLSIAWQEILQRFPESPWAHKSDFIEELART